ncbi:hypothetical protein SAMN04488535_1657 [Corynebacterium mycetoides]|uniref:Uncharacterized protein n=1 Tax=Corynebacterium mycetoides TaxID=38302 RepID=A0A1G9PYQ9_9CORY|nr:hypothetical protein [Corynebacterium mycetoides]SDM03621.1 hypothetical protein SAMN04488535_1657 [Corynebacterium mycetoides]
MTSRLSAVALAAALTVTTLSAPFASADPIDDVLAKLPSGPISCQQASRYWTNDADYQSRVRQAQTIARFDSRGPQILAALARVDEAANRCGLKGTSNANPAPLPAPAPAAPAAPAQTPAAPALPVIVLAPQGVPTFDVPVADIAIVRLPDLAVMAANGSSLPF